VKRALAVSVCLVVIAGDARVIVPGAGVELIYQPVEGWTVIGRAGARRVRDLPGRAESPVTLGGSFGLDRLWLDYTFQPYRGPGSAHRIAIRIQ